MKMRKSLFWDVNTQKISPLNSGDFIIGRVLDFGNTEDWQKIRDFYGLSKIRRVAKKHIFPDARNVNFWALVLGISPKELKCTRNPSLRIPNAFLNR